MNGIILVDKPTGPSSMEMVRIARKKLRVKKAGHAGTLDPAASGLLVIAAGNATGLLPYLPLEPKKYIFDIVFGSETDTLDDTGIILSEGGSLPYADSIENTAKTFTGEYDQVPPRFSAVKINGERAYKKARKNDDFELMPRRVRIFSLRMTNYDRKSKHAAMELACGSGTYVRSLAKDIARKLETLGHAANIRRTGVGPFSVNNALRADADADEFRKAVFPPWKIPQAIPAYTASPDQLGELSHGRDILVAPAPDSAEKLFVYNEEKKLIAVVSRVEGNRYHPVRVFEGI